MSWRVLVELGPGETHRPWRSESGVWTWRGSTTVSELTFELPGRPQTLNHVSSSSHWVKSTEIKYWREAAYWAAKASSSLTTPIDIEVTQLCKPRKMPDHLGPTWAIKGAEDGFVDAGLIPDDDSRYVRRVVLNAPVKSDRDAMVFVLREVD
jgi:hypothetical protein